MPPSLFSGLRTGILDELRQDGFHRVIRNDKIVEIQEDDPPATESSRSMWTAFLWIGRTASVWSIPWKQRSSRGEGRLKVKMDSGQEFLFSDKLECKTCGITYEDPVPNLFSFNSPQGACPTCHGFGDLAVLDEDKIIPDKNKSLVEGAIEPWTKPVSQRRLRKLLIFARERGIPTDVPFKKLTVKQQHFVFQGEGAYRGVFGFFDRLQRKKYKVQVRVFLARYRKYIPCPDCQQMRLNPQARNILIEGKSIGDVAGKTVQQAQEFFSGLELTPFQKQVAEKLLARNPGPVEISSGSGTGLHHARPHDIHSQRR